MRPFTLHPIGVLCVVRPPLLYYTTSIVVTALHHRLSPPVQSILGPQGLYPDQEALAALRFLVIRILWRLLLL